MRFLNRFNLRKPVSVPLLVGFFFANTLVIYSLLFTSSCVTTTQANSQASQTSQKSRAPASFAEGQNSQAEISSEDPGLITHSRQLTFVGSRAGEGYFSADGKKMIFQSERTSGIPFYQIFLLDLKSGKTDLVSTGQGKTTCAWVYPKGQKALFASTHLDPDLEKKIEDEYALRKSPQKNKSLGVSMKLSTFLKRT